MRINHNIVALKTLHNMAKSNNSLNKTMERLSSGLRINHASDDAAGLAISQKMDTQVRGLEQANRNANDGISLIQTAEGALGEVHAMLQRVRELAVQVSNGTYSAEDRKAVQDEVKQLQNEIRRISENIEFNDKKLLNGDLDRRSFPNDESVVKIVSLSDTVKPGNYGITVIKEAEKAKVEGSESTLTGSLDGTISINGEEAKISATDSAQDVFDKLRTLGETVGVNLVSYADDGNGNPDYTKAQTFEFGKNMHLVFEQKELGKDYKIDMNGSNSALLNGLGLKAQEVKGTDSVATIDVDGTDFNATATVSTSGNMVKVKDSDGFAITFNIQEGTVTGLQSYKDVKAALAGVAGTDEQKKEAYVAYTGTLLKGGSDADATAAAKSILAGLGTEISDAIFNESQNKDTIKKAIPDLTDAEATTLGAAITAKIKIDATDDATIEAAIVTAGAGFTPPTTAEEAKEALVAYKSALFSSTDVKVLDAGPLGLQIGANEGQFMEIRIENLSPEALEIDKMNLSTVDGTQKSITIVDNAINKISSVRSKLGAYQNRLEHAVNNLSTTSENMTASLSRILDADMAFEMAEFTQKNIISQAGVSMLTQANQRPQQILQLLQG